MRSYFLPKNLARKGPGPKEPTFSKIILQSYSLRSHAFATYGLSPLQIEPAEAAASDIGGATISINLAHVLGNRKLRC